MKYISHIILITCALFIAIGSAQWFGHNAANEKVLMDNVKALTFKADQWTTTRRTQSSGQLVCTGGTASARSDMMPKVVQCVAKGSDGAGNIQWKCEADLDEKVKFGDLEVVCEGFSYPEDPYITKGSCSLEYKLEFTEKGQQSQYSSNQQRNTHQQQQQQQQPQQQFSYGSPSYGSTHGHNANTSSSSHSSFWDIVMFLVVAAIVIGLVASCGHSDRRHHSTNTVPPTQGSTPFPPPGQQQGYSTSSSSSSSYPSHSSSSSTHHASTSSGPGFWTGMVGGGLLSWLWNRPRRHQQPYYAQQPSYTQPTYGHSQPTYNSGWGSSWGGSSSSTSSYSSSPSHSTSSPSTTRTASGYGGTRRK